MTVTLRISEDSMCFVRGLFEKLKGEILIKNSDKNILRTLDKKFIEAIVVYKVHKLAGLELQPSYKITTTKQVISFMENVLRKINKSRKFSSEKKALFNEFYNSFMGELSKCEKERR